MGYGSDNRRVGKTPMGMPVPIPFHSASAAAAQIDGYLFVADEYYAVMEVRVNHAVNGGSGAAVDVKKVTAGTALASGTSVLATAFDLSAGALTAQRRSYSAGTLTATEANRLLAPGDCLALDYSGTLTALAGVGGVVVLKRLRALQRR